MAHKRMFSKDVTGSDAFREMPSSSQSLYFHLGMEADDDGFLDNYKGIMRSVGASEDDLKILLSKRFLILFPSKVVVIKHWRINNTIRGDRYNETKYLEEKRALIVKENGSYTELNGMATIGIPNGNQMATQYRIEEKRIEEDRRETVATATDQEYSKDFITFWNEYPKKVGKGDAYRKWKKMKRPELSVLLSALQTQKQTRQWQEEGGKFVPNPSTWLYQSRWEDEAVKVTSKVDKF